MKKMKSVDTFNDKNNRCNLIKNTHLKAKHVHPHTLITQLYWQIKPFGNNNN